MHSRQVPVIGPDPDARCRCSEFGTSLGESKKPYGSGNIVVDATALQSQTSRSHLRFATAAHRFEQRSPTLVSTGFDFNSVGQRDDILIQHAPSQV